MNADLFYPLVFVHLISLVVGFGSVIVIDTFGLLWLLKWWGVDLNLVRRVAAITQRLIWVGFTGLVLSGSAMLYMKWRIDSLMQIKLFLVFMVGCNGVFLHFIKKSLDKLGDNVTNVPPKIFFRIGLASTISQIGWWGAAFIGYYHRQISSVANWPDSPWLIIGVLLIILGTVAFLGEKGTPKLE